MHRRIRQNRTQNDFARTTLSGWVRRGQYHADPMLMDINVQRLQQVIDKSLKNADILMLEKKLKGKPSTALRGVCLNLLNRRLDARVVVRNTVFLLDTLAGNILNMDGTPNYTRICRIIGSMDVDITTIPEENRGGVIQTLLMSSELVR